MKSKLIDKRRYAVRSRAGAAIMVVMDLYRLQGKDAKQPPEGFKFSWVAFDPTNPAKRVLFDSHPPKGPHFHVDGDKIGVAIEWESLEKTRNLFFRMAARHFDVPQEEFK